MKLIKADFHRTVEIPGVPKPVQRPVEIDRAQTGFSSLRSLRIYRFDEGSVIDGHAEEDEVLIVVLAGKIELKMSESQSAVAGVPHTLTAASEGSDHDSLAYLPPGASYRLAARSNAEIAYARATPAGGHAPRVFEAQTLSSQNGVELLLDESRYAERLRLRLMRVDASDGQVELPLINELETHCESLIYVKGMQPDTGGEIARTDAGSISLNSWDTLVVSPGQRPTLLVRTGAFVLVLIVLAV